MKATAEFYIGTYSKDLGGMTAGGEGIYSAAIDLMTGELTVPHCAARCVNPSYLAWGPGEKNLYATREVFAADGPSVVRFRATARELEEMQAVSLQGELPCHVAVDRAGQFLTSAQYGSGDIAIFSLGEDGEILEPAQRIQHAGRGPNESRQEGPHAHYAAVLTERNMLVAVDLGLDAVIGYAADAGRGRVEPSPAFYLKTGPGSGPRHLAPLPGTSTAYVYCELSDEIYQLELTAEGCKQTGVIQAFGRTAEAEPAGAAIRISPDLRHLYVSGRSQSKIACFEISTNNHNLTALAVVETGGLSPRDFTLTPDGSLLVVANQFSDSLTSLRRNSESGLLEPTGHSTPVGSPVCILF